MALEVGKLIVELEARVNRLESGLRRGGAAVNSFRARASRAFSALGASLRRLTFRFTGFTALIAGVAGGASFVGIARGAIEAASAIDGFEIRLQNLIGSQELTTRTLDELQKTAQRVAPSLRDIVDAAATLGTVALGNAPRIRELTDTALNIQAVTGLTLTQSAQNLQRALSAGIGAADLFRERGVRAVLEALTDIPNLIDAPISEVARAFDEVFGPNGRFQGAAEDFKLTLPGAISVTRDALFNFSAALGEALSPVIIGALFEVIIPGFNRLTALIKNNREEIADLARRGFQVFANIAITTARGVIAIIRGFGQLRIATLRLSAAVLANLPKIAAALAVFGGPAGIALALGLLKITNGFSGIQEAAETASAAADDLQKEFDENNVTLDKLSAELDKASSKVSRFGERTLKEVTEAERAAQTRLAGLREAFASAAPSVDPKTQREVESALSRQISLLGQLDQQFTKVGSTTAAEIVRLGEQERKLRQNAETARRGLAQLNAFAAAFRKQAAAGNISLEERNFLLTKAANTEKAADAERARLAATEGRTAAALLTIKERIAELEAQGLDLERRRIEGAQGLGAGLAELQRLEAQIPEQQRKAAEILADFQNRISEATTLEEQVKVLEEFGRRIAEGIRDANEEIRSAVDATFSQPLFNSIKGVFDQLIRGEVPSFAEALADTSAQLLQSSVSLVLRDLQKSLTDILRSSGVGESGAGALAGALGIAGTFLARQFAGRQASVTSDQVDSIVDSAQQVRGVVVGPTDIPIFQVANAIADAFIPIEALLGEQLAVQRQIRDRLGVAGGVDTAGQLVVDDVAAAELNAGPTLI